MKKKYVTTQREADEASPHRPCFATSSLPSPPHAQSSLLPHTVSLTQPLFSEPLPRSDHLTSTKGPLPIIPFPTPRPLLAPDFFSGVFFFKPEFDFISTWLNFTLPPHTLR